jgi:hypothetical protein
MTRINLFRNFAKKNFDTTSTLIFAALLIVCSVAVGCSSDKPKPVSSNNESPIMQPMPPATPAPVAPVQQAAAKPVRKKVVHKAPATLTYADKTSGVSFQYPRKYALKTGDAATELVSSGSTPMDFAQPGGITLAAVALPESAYPHSDLTSAFFDVSVNKTLTADQCGEFSVPQSTPTVPAAPAAQATEQPATAAPSEITVAEAPVAKPAASKLIIGDLELQSAESNASGDNNIGPREASKYFHVFQNGACYEFAMTVATTVPETVPATESSIKHVDRDEVFKRLEKILATVKIKTNPVTAPEVAAEVKATATAETPAQ